MSKWYFKMMSKIFGDGKSVTKKELDQLYTGIAIGLFLGTILFLLMIRIDVICK